MSQPQKLCVFVLTPVIFLCVPSIASADAVTDWNAIAQQTIASQAASHPGATSLQSPRPRVTWSAASPR
jgi:hypothetical protein